VHQIRFWTALGSLYSALPGNLAGLRRSYFKERGRKEIGKGERRGGEKMREEKKGGTDGN